MVVQMLYFSVLVPCFWQSLSWTIRPQSATLAAVVLLYRSLAAVMIILDCRDVTTYTILFFITQTEFLN